MVCKSMVYMNYYLRILWYFCSGLLHLNEKPKSKPSRLHFSVTTNKIGNVLYRAK